MEITQSVQQSERQTKKNESNMRFMDNVKHDTLCIMGVPEGKTEKATATHSSTLAWKIQWAEEPGGLQSMGLRRVGHD